MIVAEILSITKNASTSDVNRALTRTQLEERDIAALLSPAALPYLENIAIKAQQITRQRFGRTMQLYAPLYISNECVNRCSYCGFANHLDIERITLSIDAVVSEAQYLYNQGFRHILLVAGESPRFVPVSYLEKIATAIGPMFASLSIEIGALNLDGYKRLVTAGYDGIALYQETYDLDIFKRVHLAGPKANYQRRLQAINDAGQAGFRSLGIGSLLGLGPWQYEALALVQHARELSRKFWRSRIAISFPRIRKHAGDNHEKLIHVNDRDLVQMICTIRIAMPDADLVLSTREPAVLRDNLINLGITRVSAGSCTHPGGYGGISHAGEQFGIKDHRSAEEVANTLSLHGFEPVWKDFDQVFISSSAP
ncbi:MAG: 2-iminoacetate synthase ThiH [Deltaproteobacteria bacterium]|nr:2-iminoacetate synthase ThiH [Deltaproteobacteria bacterium]